MSEVLSSTFFTFILPLLFALSIDSMSLSVVTPKGKSVIFKVTLSSWIILALTLTLPPLIPSLYPEKSAEPPVMKSGSSVKFFPLK